MQVWIRKRVIRNIFSSNPAARTCARRRFDARADKQNRRALARRKALPIRVLER
jgi:hypothetical protein